MVIVVPIIMHLQLIYLREVLISFSVNLWLEFENATTAK
jgi:hypothetical protein